MSANYKMEKNPPQKGKKSKEVLHPRLIPWDTVDTDSLAEEAAASSTFSSADIKGAVRMISDLLTRKLRDGYNVYLDGIGYFSVSLYSRPVADKSELRSESVHFKNVNFRCCAKMKHELKTIPLVRYKEPQKTTFSTDEKERRLLWYLEHHPYITTIEYQGLSGCTKYAARKDLKQFVADGILSEEGTRGMCIYVKRPEPVELPDNLVVDSNIGEL